MPKYTHRHTGTPIYAVWRSILTRCLNPRSPPYRHYGGRGIKICERWLDFENFLADMGEQPAGLEIERIDNDGDYEPNNCRWASKREQANNRRSSVFFELNGERMPVTHWCDRLGMKHSTLWTRVARGWSIQEALTRPVA